MEYRWRWVLALGLCVGHVHFIFFLLISCPTQTRFSVEYGLKTPTRNPNSSQCNISCVGSQTQISRVGHVHFIFFVLISFALGSYS